MRIVFMGTPDFAVPTLQALIDSEHQVAGVFTQPDRPAGRGKQLKASPVKECALAAGLLVYQPEKVKSPEGIAALRALSPEVIVVVAYGQILSPEILSLPPKGCINVHASLLPSYRGAAPIHWAVINGEQETGITTMLMDAGLDTGDMLLKEKIEIPSQATTGEIHDRLAVLGGELLIQTLKAWEKGSLIPVPQTGEWTYAPLLKREHEIIDWNWSSQVLHNRIRGLNPWPGAFTLLDGEILKLWQSRVMGDRLPVQAEPGTIINIENDGFLVQTGEGQLLITQVQPAGKKSMPSGAFATGRRIQIGKLLGQ